MKKVLLLSCYELGHQPFPVAMAARFLKEAGISAEITDLSVQPFPEEAIRQCDLVAISVPMHTALRIGVSAARRIRKINPDAHINFFGHYAALNSDYLRKKHADSTIGGEFETALLSLITSPEKRSDLRLDRQTFPLPFRDSLLPLEKYAHFDNGKEHLPAGYVETTRGCKHLCTHCPIPPVYNGKFFGISEETVLADIRQQVKAGARHITFGDPDFFNGPTHAQRITRALHREWPDLSFDATIKVEHLLKHRKLLPELKETGCAFITSAVESMSNTVLRNLAKGHTREEIFTALEAVQNAGITFRPTWVAFTPWTTKEDYRAMLRFLKDQDLLENIDPIQLGLRLLVPPGSLLQQNTEMHPHLRELNQENFQHEWVHPDADMEMLYQKVSGIITEDTRHGFDPTVTYKKIWELVEGEVLQFDPKRKNPPRLTESWYC